MKMRKVMALALAGVMAVGLAACGGSAGGSGSTDSGSGDAAGGSDAEAGSSYTVGVVQLVQHEALDAATDGFSAALSEELGDGVDIDVQVAAGDSATCAPIVNEFVSNGYDLIMANATPALQAAQAATADIPIVGTSVTDYATALSIDDWSGTTGINVTGYSDLAPLDGQADMLEELFPASDYAKAGVLYCSGEPNSKYQADQITTYLEDKGYTVSAYTFADSNDLQSVATSACADSDVLYIPTDNTAAANTEIVHNVASEANVPVVVGEENMCKGCGVATLSISYYDMGYEAGKMAADILQNGTDASTMEVGTVTDAVKKYNPAIVEELGITVPDDYEALELDED